MASSFGAFAAYSWAYCSSRHPPADYCSDCCGDCAASFHTDRVLCFVDVGYCYLGSIEELRHKSGQGMSTHQLRSGWVNCHAKVMPNRYHLDVGSLPRCHYFGDQCWQVVQAVGEDHSRVGERSKRDDAGVNC